MEKNQYHMPILEQLLKYSNKHPVSFHVPGHKNGVVFPEYLKKFFNPLLKIDLTELTGLDDLHAPKGIIREAEQLASEYFHALQTFFLVGGSTVGNLAMILAACSRGDKIIVQRNCHKSVMNGLELAGAQPIFIAPNYDELYQRHTYPSLEILKQAIDEHPEAKAIVLTYPDYFGRASCLRQMIELAHQHQMAVLVDEAHGVHFSLGAPFPESALAQGADIVVQSAHKMAPAMTMASYLHVNSDRIKKERIAHFLQMLQSSSPSYPLLASLDVARYFLAHLTSEQIELILNSVDKLRETFSELAACTVLPVLDQDDPTKITLQTENGISGFALAELLEQEGIYPELATHNQVLLIHGLAPMDVTTNFKKSVKRINEKLKNSQNHDIIDVSNLFPKRIQSLALSYEEMIQLPTKEIRLEEAVGFVAAEAIIPYPPGIPVVLKGEKITHEHVHVVKEFLEQGAKIQHQHIEQGINVFFHDRIF